MHQSKMDWMAKPCLNAQEIGCEEIMWYVMQVHTGKEDEIVQLCKGWIDRNILKNCFCPKYETVFKEQGNRRIVTKVLFPGYVFLDTDAIYEVYEQLRKIPEFTKVLRSDEVIFPLTEKEEQYIREHGNGEHIFEMSRGYMVGDQVFIEEGAFRGYSGHLKYVDRHNRYGIMEVELFGRMQDVRFGLEIVRKMQENTE